MRIQWIELSNTPTVERAIMNLMEELEKVDRDVDQGRSTSLEHLLDAAIDLREALFQVGCIKWVAVEDDDA